MPSAIDAKGGDAAAPLRIRHVVLSNFKRFTTLALELDPRLNIFAGDNEAGKSTVMTAVDLALSASRSKVESLGVEALFSQDTVQAFYKSGKKPKDLPTMFVELYLSPDGHPKLLHSWPPKLLRAGRGNYVGSEVMTRRADASFSR
ncbi:MAG TPA: AAA family ATPase [Roseateles sp.]|uniref:AAA family ATPase n=1 Tax=Roseateles sp. TaxID=1971397 RepID=UPI002EDB7469